MPVRVFLLYNKDKGVLGETSFDVDLEAVPQIFIRILL